MRGNKSWCYTDTQAHQISAPPEVKNIFFISVKASSIDRSHFATSLMRGSRRVESMTDPLLTLNAKWGERHSKWFPGFLQGWNFFWTQCVANFPVGGSRLCNCLPLLSAPHVPTPFLPKAGSTSELTNDDLLWCVLVLICRSVLENWYITDTNDHPVA